MGGGVERKGRYGDARVSLHICEFIHGEGVKGG